MTTDADYRRLMKWVAVALVVSVAFALLVVWMTVNFFGNGQG